MKALILPALAGLFLSTSAYAVCPSASLSITCNVPNALQHIYNEHCTKQPGKSEFESYYCKNVERLQATCVTATQKGKDAHDENGVCYTKGESGEIVGYTPDKKPTNCWKTGFDQPQMGKFVLKTMFPVANSKCN